MATMPAAPKAFPSLESGDRMTAAEFHRRYEQRPDIRKAELIEGVVYVASPLRAAHRGDPEGYLGTWLGHYVARHPDLRISHNATVRLDADNEVQPDLSLRRVRGGSSREFDGYIYGPPELVAEIAASSASIGVHDKKHAYRRAGVQEYFVWRVEDRLIDWWRLEDDDYVALEPDTDGLVHSQAFPGLRLEVKAILAGDLARVLERQDQ